MKHISFIEKGILVALVLLSFIFIFLIPPFQKPDEVTHFYKAISVAQGRLVCSHDPEGNPKNTIPAYLQDLPNVLLAKNIITDPYTKFPSRSLINLALSKTPDTRQVSEISSCALPPFFYIPTGLALAIPVAFSANPVFIFYLGRLVNALICAIVFIFSWRTIPKKFRLLLLLFYSLPAVLHQMSSYSKDAFHYALGMYACAYLLSIWESPATLKKKSIYIFIGLLVLFVLTRPQYVAFLFLVLFPFIFTKASFRKNIWLCVGTVSITFFSVFVLTKIGVYTSSVKLIDILPVQNYIFPDLQLLFIKRYPWEFIMALWSSLDQYGYTYYLKEMIGVLGSNDTVLPSMVYYIYILAIAFITWHIAGLVKHVKALPILILSVICGVSIFGIFLAMYLYSTPVGANSIAYVQGRYFTMLIPFCVIIGAWFIAKLNYKLIPLAFICITVITISSIYTRYYNYSNYYYRAINTDINLSTQVGSSKERYLKKQYTETYLGVPGKKIRGYSFYASPTEYFPEIPYELVIKDASCSKGITSHVISSASLVSDGWNDIIFASTIPGDVPYCLEFGPFSTKYTSHYGFYAYIFPDTNTIFKPLYLY